MDTKFCGKCKQNLPLSNFSKKGKRKNGSVFFQCLCKKCTKDYKDIHYTKNKQYYIDKAKIYTKEFVDWFINIKKNLICENCGESRYWVLDFHHIDPKEKDNEISILTRNCNRKKIEEEIKKCKVLCSNCHRDLHFKEKMALSSNG